MRVAIVTARPRPATTCGPATRPASVRVSARRACRSTTSPQITRSLRGCGSSGSARARSTSCTCTGSARCRPCSPRAAAAARSWSRPQADPGPISVLRRLLVKPSGRASRALLEMADRIVCSTASESMRLSHVVPSAHERMRVVPLGVDTSSIRLAEPLPGDSEVIVALSGPGRTHRIGRSIAALADLGPGYELVVAGPCAQWRALTVSAEQLGVLDRVRFLGPVDDPTMHRWLRTACVVVALSERWTSPGSCCPHWAPARRSSPARSRSTSTPHASRTERG